MKAEFRTKLIQHLLNKKDSEKGFTLIELLVVVIIIGILAAIALPAFLNEANKARQSEAKSFLTNYIKGQQIYYNENNGFAADFAQLALGSKLSTDNYTFAFTANQIKTLTTTDNNTFVNAQPKTSALKSAAGVVNVGISKDTAAGISRATLFNELAIAKKPPIDGGATAPTLADVFTLDTTTNPTILTNYEALK